MSHQPLRVLFTGYAPVHFVCFLPLYLRLAKLPGVEVHFSGGLRESTPEGYRYHTVAMYRPFGLPADHLLTMDEIAERDFDLLFAGNTKMLLPRSVGKKIQIFHGVSFRNRAVRKENMGADHFFLAGPYMKRRFHEAGLFQDNDPRSLEIGFMKTDRLVDGSLDKKALLASYGFDGSRPVLLYAPTGQKYSSIQTMGIDFIRKVRESGKYDLLVKLHDHPHDDVNWAAKVAELEDHHTRLVDSFDVIPLLFMSDLLITDASSVSSEYSLLDRPMVFLDVPELIERAARKDGSMLDLNTWGRNAGDIVPDPETALLAIEANLADPGRKSELRRAMAADLFFHPGHAVEHAMDWIRHSFLDSLAIAS